MHAHHTTRAALGAAAFTLSLMLTTAACGADDPGSSGSSSSSSSSAHNDADVRFASDMLQHHAQAIEMVDLTEGRTLDPAVQRLADQIKAAQDPEIDTFTGWLEDWDEKVPDPDAGGMGGMSGMDSDMPGMMSGDDMMSLDDAPDAAFQTMWLRMMTAHHTGALEMARTEVEDGRYAPAVALAKRIIASQTEEIATMKRLLAS